MMARTMAVRVVGRVKAILMKGKGTVKVAGQIQVERERGTPEGTVTVPGLMEAEVEMASKARERTQVRERVEVGMGMVVGQTVVAVEEGEEMVEEEAKATVDPTRMEEVEEMVSKVRDRAQERNKEETRVVGDQTVAAVVVETRAMADLTERVEM